MCYCVAFPSSGTPAIHTAVRRRDSPIRTLRRMCAFHGVFVSLCVFFTEFCATDFTDDVQLVGRRVLWISAIVFMKCKMGEMRFYVSCGRTLSLGKKRNMRKLFLCNICLRWRKSNHACFLRDVHCCMCMCVRKRIFLLGPSHHLRSSKCLLSSASHYESPVGDLKVDQAGESHIV